MENTQTQEPAGQPGLKLVGGARRRKGKTGRVDPEGQEAVIDVTGYAESVPKAVKILKEIADLKTDYNEMVKDNAKKFGVKAAPLNRSYKARASDDFEEKKRQHEQLSLLFDVDC